MSNLLDCSGEVALVTGAAAGMGLATAHAFAEAGSAVVLADFKEDRVKAAAQKLPAAGHKVFAVRCDVSEDTQWPQWQTAPSPSSVGLMQHSTMPA
jgi:NAD(P)-dependent dehydrogenase (short-subunit alcohol dehydrogenase family)